MRRNSIIFKITLLVVGLALGSFAWAAGGDKPVKSGAKAEAPAQLDWIGYGEALERAQAENKHIVIDFYTSWCGWCKVMDKKTYTDPTVLKLLDEHFVSVKLNAESSRKFAVGDVQMSGVDVARQFRVQQFPMTWFVKPDGERLANIPGYIPPERFIKILEYVQARKYEDDRQANEEK